MIKYRLKLIKSKGQVESNETLISGPSIVIGRGENVDLRFEDPLVSYRHAELTATENCLKLTDLNSFSGVKVNGKTVLRATLEDGDIISIGLYTIEIKREGTTWILDEERRSDRAKGEEEFISNTLKSASFKDNLPSMTTLSLFLVVAILVGFFYLPLSTSNKDSWNPGPISNEHKLLAKDCSSCHTVPFQKVSNSTCQDCHKMGGHRMDLHANQNHEKLLCTNCHSEHNGSKGLIVKEEQLCTSCHHDLKKILENSKTENLDNFQNHPDFKINLFLKKSRILLKEAEDTNTLKLNHEVHLKGAINGADKKELLNCGSCHILDKDKKSFQSVKFESSCERCHSLGFTKLASEVKAPHASPDEVFYFILRFFANESLAKEGKTVAPDNKRIIPGTVDKRSLELFFLRKDVMDQSRKAEHELFTKLSCNVCHEVKKTSSPLANENLSSFSVTPPEERTTWFPSADFDHYAHANMLCKDCHKGVSQSSLTSDVLIPDVKSCKECHGDQDHTQKVSSTCISCHPYHQLEPENNHKQNAPR